MSEGIPEEAGCGHEGDAEDVKLHGEGLGDSVNRLRLFNRDGDGDGGEKVVMRRASRGLYTPCLGLIMTCPPMLPPVYDDAIY